MPSTSALKILVHGISNDQKKYENEKKNPLTITKIYTICFTVLHASQYLLHVPVFTKFYHNLFY